MLFLLLPNKFVWWLQESTSPCVALALIGWVEAHLWLTGLFIMRNI